MTRYICTKRIHEPHGMYIAHDCGWDPYTEEYSIYDTYTARIRESDGHTVLEGMRFEFVEPTFSEDHPPWRIDPTGCEYPNEYIDEARVDVKVLRDAYERMIKENKEGYAKGRTFGYDRYKASAVTLDTWIKGAEGEIDFIEKIEDNRRWTNDALENTVVLLNIDCPICGKHEVYVRSAIFNNPVIVGGDMRRCSVIVGCVPCGELMVWCADPDLTMDEYKDLINKALVYDWLDAVSRDPNIHAWRRDRLYDVANGIEPPEFWQHAYEPRMRACRYRASEMEGEEE